MTKWIIIFIVILLIWYFREDKKTYSDISNYEFDNTAEQVFKDARKKIKSRSPAEHLEGAYIAGNIMEHNILPNSPAGQNDHLNDQIEYLYEEALNTIEVYPEVAANPDLPINVNTMINHIEDVLGEGYHIDNAREVVREELKGSPDYYQTDVKSDPQNVHDPEVTNELKLKYQKLVNKNRFLPPAPLNDLRKLVDGKALNAINLMGDNEISSLNTTEGEVLQQTWTRINSPENKDQKENLIEALKDQLSSIYERDHPVCITGRCSRVLDSLTLLDYDPHLQAPIKTAEILRQEIFSKTYNLIQHELAKAPKEVADAYNGSAEGDTGEFEEQVKAKIERSIREDYPHVKPKILESLILDAQAGV